MTRFPQRDPALGAAARGASTAAVVLLCLAIGAAALIAGSIVIFRLFG